MTEFSAVIIAAGESKRMKSMKSKELHKVCGKEIINHVIDSVIASGIKSIQIVTDTNTHDVKDVVCDRAECVCLDVKKSDFCALMQTKSFLEKTENVVVLKGNMPLITADTLAGAIKEHQDNNNDVTALVPLTEQEKGCGDKSPCIKEIGSGMYIFKTEKILALSDAGVQNKQREEYTLSDAEADIAENGGRAGAYVVEDTDDLVCVCDRLQLAMAEKTMQRRINTALMLSGVTIIDPDNTFICSDAVIGIDTVVYPGTIIEGKTVIGKNVYIGPNCKITDAVIGDNTDVNISTIVESSIGSNTHVGPYAYIRPGCTVGSDCKVGDFVELKKAQIGDKTKLSHLTYVGDAEVGSGVNFGCGTVVVNYDGKNKYKTVIKDNAFIGCNSNLVSPVTVNEGAYIAAGSTITDEVPENTLAIARARQVIKENWQDRRKK